MTALEKIRRADAVRVRRGELTIGDEKIALNVRIYSMEEFLGMIKRFEGADNQENAGFLCEQFLDPDTGERVFATADDILTISGAAMIGLLKLFRAANNGELEKKS